MLKKTKLGKISALGSVIYGKQSIVYIYACIKGEVIGEALPNTDSNDVLHSHSWNDKDFSFDYQLSTGYWEVVSDFRWINNQRFENKCWILKKKNKEQETTIT